MLRRLRNKPPVGGAPTTQNPPLGGRMVSAPLQNQGLLNEGTTPQGSTPIQNPPLGGRMISAPLTNQGLLNEGTTSQGSTPQPGSGSGAQVVQGTDRDIRNGVDRPLQGSATTPAPLQNQGLSDQGTTLPGSTPQPSWATGNVGNLNISGPGLDQHDEMTSSADPFARLGDGAQVVQGTDQDIRNGTDSSLNSSQQPDRTETAASSGQPRGSAFPDARVLRQQMGTLQTSGQQPPGGGFVGPPATATPIPF